MKTFRLTGIAFLGITVALAGCSSVDEVPGDVGQADEVSSSFLDSDYVDSGHETAADQSGQPTDSGRDGCDSHEQCLTTQRCLDGQCLDEPPECMDEDRADPSACQAACAMTDCKASQGVWTCSPFSCGPYDPSTCFCVCRTTDSGCTCWDDSHCQGWCDFKDEFSIEPEICGWFGKCSHLDQRGYWGCRCALPGTGPPVFNCAS